jgi:hypothetical protein
VEVVMMSPFNVTVADVPDGELGGLLSALSRAGFPQPVITEAGHPEARRVSSAAAPELPAEWKLVRERAGESYRWPDYREEYSAYAVYQAEVRPGEAVHIALGHAVRENKWGRDRRYVVAFLSAGAPVTPLVEFLESDDYDASGDYVAIIRGVDGGRKMYGPGDSLPDAYVTQFRTALYRDRIDYSGVFNKMVVVVSEDDYAGMCNHALLQAQRRGDI